MKQRMVLPLKDITEYNPQTPSLEKVFREYIEGKKVVIIGRAGIHDLKQGEFIDAHDVVVRVHANVPYTPKTSYQSTTMDYDPVVLGEFIPKEWHKIMGKRVDVLYLKYKYDIYEKYQQTPPVDNLNDYIKQYLTIVKKAGVKFICRDVMTNQQHHDHSHASNHTTIRYPSWELRDWISCQLEEGMVEAGVMAIADILVQKPGSLYVTGFPCFYERQLIPGMPKMPPDSSRMGNLRFLCHLSDKGRITCDGRMEKLFDIMVRRE